MGLIDNSLTRQKVIRVESVITEALMNSTQLTSCTAVL